MTARSVVLLLFAALLCTCDRTTPESETERNYRLLHRVFTQPVSHRAPDGPTLEQHVDILIPDEASSDAPVFFNLGNEQDLTPEDLAELRESFGAPDDVIFVQAEHRGYGQSLTTDPDQSVPSYVRIEEVLADAHRVILELRRTYSGPWMAGGWSYGGGLVIDFAARYPNDVSVILSSSGVVDWPFVMDAYDRQIRNTLGDAAYRRLVRHATNLEPGTLFDEAWLEREFLLAVVHGVVQMGGLKALQPYFRLLTYLPTRAFLPVLHAMDNRYGKGEAQRYARSNARLSLTREEALTGAYGWRVWRYQQCAQTGVFEISAEPGGLMTRTASDYVDECRALFGEDPPAATASSWSPRASVARLGVPLVYVNGGMDPWAGLGLEPDRPLARGRYFHRPNGQHCPERDDAELAREVLAEMLRFARVEP